MGDGVEQVGFAQAAVAVDEQGVVALAAGILRHGVGGGIGQLVLGSDDEGLKGEAVAALRVAGMVRPDAVVGGQHVVIQDLHLQVGGEDVLQGRLDVLDELLFDDVLFEGVAAVEHEGRVLHGDHVHLVEPHVDGGLGQLGLQLPHHAFPYVGVRIQSKRPFPTGSSVFSLSAEKHTCRHLSLI